MHNFLSYLSVKTLDSREYLGLEHQAKDVLDLFKSKHTRLKFYDDFLSKNKIKQAALGQFHTPESVVNIVLDCLPNNFEERILSGGKLLDPSCGTGNFLIEVIKRIEKKLIASGDRNPLDTINKKIIPNIYGFEIDPLVISAAKKVIQFEFEGKLNLPNFFHVDALVKENSLLAGFTGFFDFVVGNPPWVEVKTLENEIKDYVQSNYEVSNLYGAFLLRGKDFLKSSGHLSYVLPRSFTGGKYYSSLRKKLKEETSIKNISYYKNRNQNFHGGKVLQEMVVISFENDFPTKKSKVSCIPCSDFADFQVNNGFMLEQEELFSNHDLIMILADSFSDFLNIKTISSFKNFEDQGFRFSTGQLVVHRSKNFLRSTAVPNSYRIIYPNNIENICSEMHFTLSSDKIDSNSYAVTTGVANLDGRAKNQSKKISESNIEKYCNKFDEIILCRRRSHKGDKRRFVGAYVSDQLPKGYFIDNGLNFIVTAEAVLNAPSLKALSRLLRSDLFEYFFECISSNTQINKNDMYLFGIPSVTQENKEIYKQLENCDFNDVTNISLLVEQIYGIKLGN